MNRPALLTKMHCILLEEIFPNVFWTVDPLEDKYEHQILSAPYVHQPMLRRIAARCTFFLYYRKKNTDAYTTLDLKLAIDTLIGIAKINEQGNFV